MGLPAGPLRRLARGDVRGGSPPRSCVCRAGACGARCARPSGRRGPRRPRPDLAGSGNRRRSGRRLGVPAEHLGGRTLRGLQLGGRQPRARGRQGRAGRLRARHPHRGGHPPQAGPPAPPAPPPPETRTTPGSLPATGGWPSRRAAASRPTTTTRTSTCANLRWHDEAGEPGQPVGGGPARRRQGRRSSPAISANGRLVAFPSRRDEPRRRRTPHGGHLRPGPPPARRSDQPRKRRRRPSGGDGSFEPHRPQRRRPVRGFIESLAKNLSPEDDEQSRGRNVFVRDLGTRGPPLAGEPGDRRRRRRRGTTTRATPPCRPTAATSRSTRRPTTSRPRTTRQVVNVFVRDAVNRTTTLVSRATGAAGARRPTPTRTSRFISPDGRSSRFRSDA